MRKTKTKELPPLAPTLPIDLSSKPEPALLTALGGLALVAQTFRTLKLAESVERHVVVKQRERGFSESEVVESLVLLHAAGEINHAQRQVIYAQLFLRRISSKQHARCKARPAHDRLIQHRGSLTPPTCLIRRTNRRRRRATAHECAAREGHRAGAAARRTR